MKRTLAIFATVVLSAICFAANAGDFGELTTRLHATRAAMVDFTLHKDKRGEEQQQLIKDSTDAVSAQLAAMKAPTGKGTQFNELVETWNAFKETREKELIPAILKGDEETARGLAVGIQKERMAKLLALIRELEQ